MSRKTRYQRWQGTVSRSLYGKDPLCATGTIGGVCDPATSRAGLSFLFLRRQLHGFFFLHVSAPPTTREAVPRRLATPPPAASPLLPRPPMAVGDKSPNNPQTLTLITSLSPPPALNRRRLPPHHVICPILVLLHCILGRRLLLLRPDSETKLRTWRREAARRRGNFGGLDHHGSCTVLHKRFVWRGPAPGLAGGRGAGLGPMSGGPIKFSAS
jgi:hypothetical protein